MAPLVLLILLASGCGRIGVEPIPLEAGFYEDDDGGLDGGGFEEFDGDIGLDLDAGAELDGSDPNADAAGSGDGSASDGSASDAGVDACAFVDGSCTGCNVASYTPSMSCGVGYCRTSNTASRCLDGIEVACVPGAPRAATDTTFDGVDDDCDGQIDEDPGATRTDTYRPGSYALTPPVGATMVSVRLWGGAGASGDAQAGFWGVLVTGGHGGAGGYAEQVFTVSASTALQLNVGGGGRGCPTVGTGGIAAHNGGAGGTGIGQVGSNGADGTRTGGTGGNPSSGGNGGNGSFGGGGGGAGSEPGFARHGAGGGGGAATVMTISGVSVIAGGGGGGGGAGSNITTAGFSGGNGGSGCNGIGLAPTSEGGGGGGGGVCQGTTRTQAGTGRTPYDPTTALPAGYARGGNASVDCEAGGDGYATVTYTR